MQQVEHGNWLLQEGDGGAGMSEICLMILKKLDELQEGQNQINANMLVRQQQVDQIERKLDQHSDDSKHKHEQLLSAFPSSDTEGHRRYHQAVIERIELRNKMINEALIQCAKVGGVAAIGWLLWAVWIAVKHEVTK